MSNALYHGWLHFHICSCSFVFSMYCASVVTLCWKPLYYSFTDVCLHFNSNCMAGILPCGEQTFLYYIFLLLRSKILFDLKMINRFDRFLFDHVADPGFFRTGVKMFYFFALKLLWVHLSWYYLKITGKKRV